MRIAVAGSTGLIGSALVPALEAAGHEVVRLIRPATAGADGIEWDPEAGTLDGRDLAGIEAVINLAGRSIGSRRWSDGEMSLVESSRVESTALLARVISGMESGPSILINASAVGFYGDRPHERLDESSSPGDGFFPDVCVAWEQAAAPAVVAGLRVAFLRTGIVLSAGGGALDRILAPVGPKWLSPYRWGLGGWIGNGRNIWPWIALDDEIRAIAHLLTSNLSGPVNVTAPDPVSNKRFLKAVGSALRRPVLLPIPRFVVSLLLGRRLAKATLFDSQDVRPDVLVADGFVFRHTDVETAVADALKPL